MRTSGMVSEEKLGVNTRGIQKMKLQERKKP